MAVVTMRQLLESGVHFGHQTRRWNPKMKRFIMTERNGIYIIDLQQSLTYINNAYEFVKETVAHGGTILFVGTKKQAQEPVAEQATRVGMPYVNHRWLGGMLTNFTTISKRLTRLKELEEINFDDVASSGHTKKELLILKREKDKLERTLGGIRSMAKVPSAVWIIDTKKEHLAVDEARKLGLPVIAILDTNCDPDEVDYKIPGNDDAIRSVTLLTRVIADAVAEGLVARAGARSGEGEGGVGAEEPLAEWERELYAEAAAEVEGAAPSVAEEPADSPEVVLAEEPADSPEPVLAEEPADSPEPALAEEPADCGCRAARRGGACGRGAVGLTEFPHPSTPPTPRERTTTMANFTAADIKALREQTAAGMLDVKKALEEADGDMAKAAEILRVKGLKGVTKREGRSASNGLVAARAEDGSGTLVEVNCETDFVAKGERFLALADQVLDQAVATSAADADTLLASTLPDGRSVQALLDDGNATIGEKIEVRRIARLEGERVVAYLHRTSKDLPPQIGVLVATTGGDESVARDVAMHVAAFSPTVLTREEIPPETVAEERRLAEATVARGGQAGGGAAQDRRGPPQRLLQGERPARAGLRQGPEEVSRAGAQGGRRRGDRVSPLPGRQLTSREPPRRHRGRAPGIPQGAAQAVR